ncbi:MAG: hypothetical protein ABMA14_20155 [Hyphomonadaceae bacterium]
MTRKEIKQRKFNGAEGAGVLTDGGGVGGNPYLEGLQAFYFKERVAMSRQKR